ncbi:hypothetical protein D9611_006486 [Ephemerocybe angulata]|uniref:AB hydrolase-1 domain-containing protein n=1 Tax=Ephemerocybe angulata TaxID=980116 RepID=A0A8H5C778_9AGAR|nr:hypothetical protein D9611_006486 [Tulosesus angulatus]
MPHIPVSCPSGNHEFWYSISTPTSPNAKQIVPELPTVLFIHSGYCASETFEAQFSDPRLRQFNLLAIDALGHGGTRGTIGDQPYATKETAEDLRLVLDALHLDKVHIFGLANGGTIGLELASAYPERVLSLTICSPIPPTEPEEVIAGRMELFNHWAEADAQAPDSTLGEQVSRARKEMVNEAATGLMQLLFGFDRSPLEEALRKYALTRDLDIWSGSPEKLKQCFNTSVRWFTERSWLTQESLSKVQCAVHIIHCSEDVGYPYETAQEMEKSLQDAGVRVSLSQVHGAHYGVLTNGEEINAILRDQVIEVADPKTPLPQADFPCGRMRTPWTDNFRRFGWLPGPPDTDDNSDSESDYYAGWIYRDTQTIVES